MPEREPAGSNGGMNAFAASAFPYHARATGVAWMHPAGKLGAILAGLLGGLMIGAGWVIGAIFVGFAVPLVIAAGASPSWPTDPARGRTVRKEPTLSDSPEAIKTADVAEGAWTGAFEAKRDEAFGETLADDVVLEAAALVAPLRGRAAVQATMGAASNYYTSLQFTHEATNGPRTYVEWQASGPSGVQFSGVTVLTRNDDGMIEHISISHRPLGALLEFSAEMHRRTQGKIEPGHFRAEG